MTLSVTASEAKPSIAARSKINQKGRPGGRVDGFAALAMTVVPKPR